MGKNRELASAVSARIWKTVVFSGAMLASPMASAEQPAPGPSVVKPQVRTAAEIQAELAEVDGRIEVTIESIVAAPDDATRTTTKAELDRLDKQRKTLRSELKALKLRPAASTPAVARAELALTSNETKIMRFAAAVATAKTDKDREAHKAKLAAAQKERVSLSAKLVAAKDGASKPRPRTPVEPSRPMGRGFVLS